MPKLPGINHQRAVNALKKAGFRVLRQGKHITMTDGERILTIPCANEDHSLFNELQSLVRKYAGVDQLIETLIKKLGDVKTAYLVGDYARGIDSGLIDIILLGKINKMELNRIAERRGKDISRKIRPMVITVKELRSLWKQLNMDHALLIWGNPITKK